MSLRFKVQNFEEIKSKLKELGAYFKGTKVEEELYFVHVLDEKRRWWIKLKGSWLISKSKKIKVESLKADVLDFLAEAGFIREAGVLMLREIWKLKGLTISLDSVEGLGDFVEVSGEKLEQILPYLGLKLEDGTKKSYLEMLKELKEKYESRGYLRYG